MGIKELSLIKYVFLIVCVFNFGCSQPKEGKKNYSFEQVDVSQIPNDTIFQNNSTLSLQNGVYYIGSRSYSGFIKDVYETNTLKIIGSYFQGKQHGTTKTFFPNGKLETLRNYRNGMAYGQHLGYWQNGNKKFNFIYFNDKREGIQKQWYENGSPYCELSFTDDQENGMQKAWRENGKPYINYEVKDGVRYGLQKSALCYTLKDEKLK
jgi:antitoxin component YwqK of YwqJK toxin-antitoxin module